MLTDLKLSSLAGKCVFHRPEQNANGGPIELNFEGLEMQKWNIPTDRAQKRDTKNGVICLVMMSTPGVMVIKMSKMAHFFNFLLMTANSKSKFWEIIQAELNNLVKLF